MFSSSTAFWEKSIWVFGLLYSQINFMQSSREGSCYKISKCYRNLLKALFVHLLADALALIFSVLVLLAQL